jgi:formylglycine-generating enzyme required for sulfatase activity
MTPGDRPQNPFPGLRPFEPDESGLFFGRDEQIGEALERLMRQKLLAVVGMSGCGKSSLVRAGMVPALEMGLAGDPRQQWRIAIMRPGDGPVNALERCLGFGDGSLPERTYGLREAVKAHLPNENLLLVVDQFEETFPLRDRGREDGGSQADLFVSYLLSAAQDPAARIYIVLTMRSDYLGECAKFRGLPEALNDGQYLVPRMTRAQLQEAIESPLETIDDVDGKPVRFHQGLVQKLLNDCDEEPDNLPVLQHLLRRLFEEWDQQGATGQITPAMATKVGGLKDALKQDAELVFEQLQSDQQRMAETIFRRITESRRQADGRTDDRPVRSPQTVADLAALTESPGEDDVRAVVKCFKERALLVVRPTDEGDKVDLPHECLCLKWDRLKSWIEQEAKDAEALRFLADSVRKGQQLTGSTLAEAVAWQEAGRLKGAWAERYLDREKAEEVPQADRPDRTESMSATARLAVDGWVTKSQRLERAREQRQRRELMFLRAVAGLVVLAVAWVVPQAVVYVNARSDIIRKHVKWVDVPVGERKLGCQGDTTCKSYQREAHTVRLEAFQVMPDEVTRDAFNDFVNLLKTNSFVVWSYLGAFDTAAIRKRYADAPPSEPPASSVTWFEADAFCRFVGGRLPQEDEWEFAARTAEEPSLGNMLAGVREWTSSVEGTKKVARGGSFLEPAGGTALENYVGYEPWDYQPDMGFRCVR